MLLERTTEGFQTLSTRSLATVTSLRGTGEVSRADWRNGASSLQLQLRQAVCQLSSHHQGELRARHQGGGGAVGYQAARGVLAAWLRRYSTVPAVDGPAHW